MVGWSLATRVGACGAALAEDVYPQDGIAGFGGGLCGSLSTDTDVRRALSFRTGMAQYSQRRLRRPSGHIHHLTSELRRLPSCPCTCWCLDAQLTRGTLALDSLEWSSPYTGVEVVSLELVKRPQTYINIHHHHRHATTMTVMLVPRRPASEIDIKHT